MSGPFTDAVKQELAGVALPSSDDGGDVELAWLLRSTGALVRSGSPARTSLVMETTSGAVARRTFALLHEGHGVRAALQVRSPGGVRRRASFGLRVDEHAEHLAAALGLTDATGLPVPARPTEQHPLAAVRGALLGAGSLSSPGRPPHLEVACHDRATADSLAGAVRTVVTGRITVVDGGDRPRVVAKSGRTIAELLTALGVPDALEVWDEQRSRRRLRAEATRLANADSANLRRSVAAAAVQVASVERLVADRGWDGLDEDLRGVALARLTSPDATLGELGQLVDPPLSRSAVHRRLTRITELADEVAQGPRAGGAHPGGG